MIKAEMTIGRVDDKEIGPGELDVFIDAFLEWLEGHGYECAAGWSLIDEDSIKEDWNGVSSNRSC